MRAAAIAALLLSVPVSGTVHAAPQFTADAIETEPGHDMRYVRLHFGEKGSRYEFQVSGQPVVQIVKPAEGIALTLFPLSRTYLESKNVPSPVPAAFRPMVPCEPSPVVECRREADTQGESQAAQKIERWTVVTMSEPAGVHRWWDPQRKFAVREEFHDGRVMQANMLGTTSLDNRTVENWEFLYLSPYGGYQRGLSLFSPDLGFAVAEKQPGGVSRELRNIQPGEPDSKLFEVPEGYKKVDVTPPALLSPPGTQPGRNMVPHAPGQPFPVSLPNAPTGQTAPMTMPQPQVIPPSMPIGFPSAQTQASSATVTAPASSNGAPSFAPYGQGPVAEAGIRP
jgi:hypothetical protein